MSNKTINKSGSLTMMPLIMIFWMVSTGCPSGSSGTKPNPKELFEEGKSVKDSLVDSEISSNFDDPIEKIMKIFVTKGCGSESQKGNRELEELFQIQDSNIEILKREICRKRQYFRNTVLENVESIQKLSHEVFEAIPEGKRGAVPRRINRSLDLARRKLFDGSEKPRQHNRDIASVREEMGLYVSDEISRILITICGFNKSRYFPVVAKILQNIDQNLIPNLSGLSLNYQCLVRPDLERLLLAIRFNRPYEQYLLKVQNKTNSYLELTERIQELEREKLSPAAMQIIRNVEYLMMVEDLDGARKELDGIKIKTKSQRSPATAPVPSSDPAESRAEPEIPVLSIRDVGLDQRQIEFTGRDLKMPNEKALKEEQMIYKNKEDLSVVVINTNRYGPNVDIDFQVSVSLTDLLDRISANDGAGWCYCGIGHQDNKNLLQFLDEVRTKLRPDLVLPKLTGYEKITVSSPDGKKLYLTEKKRSVKEKFYDLSNGKEVKVE